MNLEIITGDCREELAKVGAQSVQCCVTSPPYWGLRSYLPKGHPLKAREIGQERTPQDYVDSLRAVFGGKENPVGVWRALRADGTLWLNLGDSYAAQSKKRTPEQATRRSTIEGSTRCQESILHQNGKIVGGLKAKDLVGIPWLVAFALRAEGWYLRSDIIWAKPNCMPESVTDRPTRSHEYFFLLTKAPRYFYDAEAIKEAPSPELVKQVQDGYNGSAIKDYLKMNVQDASATKGRIIDRMRSRIDKQCGHGRRHNGFNDKWDVLTPAEQAVLGANKRDVWRVSPANYPEAHFATFPPELITPCILAGTSAKGCCAKCGAPWERVTDSSKSFLSGSGRSGNAIKGKNGEKHQGGGNTGDIRKGPVNTTFTLGWQPTCNCPLNSQPPQLSTVPCTVLDPFGGSGTTAQVALEYGRRAVICELNAEYVPLIKQRTAITPGLALA